MPSGLHLLGSALFSVDEARTTSQRWTGGRAGHLAACPSIALQRSIFPVATPGTAIPLFGQDGSSAWAASGCSSRGIQACIPNSPILRGVSVLSTRQSFLDRK